MKPYYSDDYVTIYHADCLEILPKLKRQSANIIITDPPYSVGINSSGKKSSYGDNSLIKPFMRDLGRELFDIATINGALYINTDWRTYPVWWDVLSQIKPLTNLIVNSALLLCDMIDCDASDNSWNTFLA